jgi:ZIP family zinc transporter
VNVVNAVNTVNVVNTMNTVNTVNVVNGWLWVAGGLGFIFLMTSLGAAMVFLFGKNGKGPSQSIFLGFAAGVMIAASVWGLLAPAIEEAEAQGWPGWIPAAGGFILGVLFLYGLDKIIPHLHPSSNVVEGIPSTAQRTTLLVWAVTLHNIPEGMAVGLSFALAAQHPEISGTEIPRLYVSAMALALGIGIQNFPEGAAISIPLKHEGMSPFRAFLLGAFSGIVEPVFGVLAVFLATLIAPQMPWLLAFAAGAMMYVVVEELIPEANLGSHSNVGTMGVMAGFVLMMILDVALG